MYATKLKINLCNFLAIWAVLSILLDTQSNDLQHVKNLQQAVNDYYDKRPIEVMSRLEHQIMDIMNAMYDSVTNDDFDSVSNYTDRVSGAVDNDTDRNDKDEMPYDNDKDEMPYDKDEMPYENDKDEMPYDNDKDEMPYDSDDNQMPYEYDNDNDSMCKSMEDRQINDFYKAGDIYKAP